MTALTFALVVAVFIIVMSLAVGMEKAFASSGDPLNVIVLRPGAQSEGQSQVQHERYQIIRNLEGIARAADGEPLVAPEVIVLENKQKRGAPEGVESLSNLQIRGVSPQSFEMRPNVKLVAGEMFDPALREAIVSRRVSERFEGMDLNAKIRLSADEWTIVGLFEAGGSAFDSEVWTDHRRLAESFDRRGAYSSIAVRAIDAAAAQSLIQRIEDDPQLKLEPRIETEYYESQTTSSTIGIKILAGILAVVMSIGVAFAGANAMYANVANRTREIGAMRVLGFTPFSILICFVLESIALALLGGGLGCLLSLPMNGVATGTTNFTTFSEIAFAFTITPKLMLQGLTIGLAIGFFGGLLPAFSASRRPIVETLRKA